mgnify:CR=1 FL=1
MNPYQRLHTILDTLRRDCPWDREQTHLSLRYLTIEEVHELSEAILAQQHDEVRKELGDLFLHLLFYSKIAEDEGWFTLDEVLTGICDKLLSRHPHIALPDSEGRLVGGHCEKPEWEKVKMKEGRKSVLEGVPASLPTLVKCVRMQEKAAGMGFEFPSEQEAAAKVREEQQELAEALAEGDRQHMEEEYGDLLFALVKWGRFHGLNADDALARANQKFQRRFTFVEQSAREQGRSLAELSLDEMMSLWRQAKATE